MKKTILLLSAILLFLAGCKKFDEIEASKVVIIEENIEKGWDYIKINVEYDYPVESETVKLYLSEKEDMSGAESYSCNVEGKKFSVEVEGLKGGVDYYYCYEYDNGYGKEKSEKKNVKTIEKPLVVTREVSGISTTSAKLKGSVTNKDGVNKITEVGFCWDTKQEPSIEGSHYNNGSMNGTGTSEFLYNLTSLQDNVTYYVRAYVKTNFGVIYGDEKSFKTVEVTLPTVKTNAVTDIKTNSATCGGNVTSDGNATVTARGLCWSISPNPTINDNKTNNGSGTGSFTSTLNGLTGGTKYYVRAYATNEKGTAYGEERSFTTAKVFDEIVDSYGNSIITLNGSVVFKMIAVEGGTFQMGATSEQGNDALDSEKPVHSVTLSDYYIGETEVTQELWTAVMGSNPSYFSGYPQRPVEKVSWNDCQEFITKLNQLTGKNFRLPTEAEWEYAARGGNKSQGYKYSGSNTIGDVAWYTDNSSSQTHDVKTKQANELGIYDMSGNVWEWSQDWYGDYSSSSQTNPTGPSSGSYRVLRGGSRSSFARGCRVSNRNYCDPGGRGSSLGLRLSLSQY